MPLFGLQRRDDCQTISLQNGTFVSPVFEEKLQQRVAGAF